MRVVHRLDHVGDELADAVVHRLDGLGDETQAGVGNFDDGKNGHDGFATVSGPNRQASGSDDRPPRPQRLGQRAFVEIIEFAADRQAMR